MPFVPRERRSGGRIGAGGGEEDMTPFPRAREALSTDAAKGRILLTAPACTTGREENNGWKETKKEKIR